MSSMLDTSALGKLVIFSGTAPTPEVLASGLGGAIGCDYRPLRHQLLFVEYATGRLSRLNLVPTGTVVSSGTRTIPGTYEFDFETGNVPAMGDPNTPPYDVWWEQIDTTHRRLVPMNGARIARLGPVSYTGLSYAELMALSYGTAPIVGDAGMANQLADGTVFAVKTAAGHYAKAQVLNYGYDLQIRWTTYQVAPMYQVLGTGYAQPEDVKVSASETHAYVTERTGSLLRVDLSAPNRAAATVVCGGMTAPQQMALDEARNQAFVVEYAASGRLLRIDLGTGAMTVMATALDHAVGVVVTQDQAFAYVSEQASTGGRVVRIRLATGQREVVADGLTSPFFLTWTDPGESGILVPERDPANRVTRIDLASTPATARVIVPSVAFRPSSVAVMDPTRLLVCSDQVIAEYELASSVYTPVGPMLLGIGHVPADRIVDGYADTTGDPGYFFQVKDSPFGGTLPVMFNHDKAYDAGARWYKLTVDGMEPRQGFVDYRWSTSANHFVAQSVNPSAGGYYPVRPPSELWFNHWLGYMLSTAGLPNGLHTLRIRLYSAQSAAAEIGTGTDAGRSSVVRIDNTVPAVSIDQVLHAGNPVATCGIVDTGPDDFTFRVTANDADGHLAGWSLAVLWGDNHSAPIASDSYAAHVSPSHQWSGISGSVVPPAPWHATVAGDPTSKRCAHTFQLAASSRVIDGWTYLHYVVAYRSITLLLP
jgi:hypothetical protein